MGLKKKDRLRLLNMAYQKYVDWWLPIDVANGSVMAPITFHRFLGYLLIFPEDTWWNRWIGDVMPDDKLSLKQFILELIIKHYTQETNGM